jgi:hypothetical protein
LVFVEPENGADKNLRIDLKTLLCQNRTVGVGSGWEEKIDRGMDRSEMATEKMFVPIGFLGKYIMVLSQMVSMYSISVTIPLV